MRKIILTVLATSLIAASTVQMADAAERHVRHAHHDSFRGAYNQLSTPSNTDTGSNWRDDAKFLPAGN
jgi:predicted secreted protein